MGVSWCQVGVWGHPGQEAPHGEAHSCRLCPAVAGAWAWSDPMSRVVRSHVPGGGSTGPAPPLTPIPHVPGASRRKNLPPVLHPLLTWTCFLCDCQVLFTFASHSGKRTHVDLVALGFCFPLTSPPVRPADGPSRGLHSRVAPPEPVPAFPAYSPCSAIWVLVTFHHRGP